MKATSNEPQATSDDERWNDDQPDEVEFQFCSECDGHDACADFGCAIELGLGHLVKQPI